MPRATIALLVASLVLLDGCVPRQRIDAQPRAAVKLIEYGWDTPTPNFVRAHLQDMSELPFDGVVMRLPDGGGDVFRVDPAASAIVDAQAGALQAIRSPTLTDNFLIMFAASNMDWFSDADWSVVTQHASAMARAAVACHCRGLVFDTEPYDASPWTYATQRHAATETFAAYEDAVRRRGREFMRALQSADPQLDLVVLEAYSYFARTAGSAINRDNSLRAHVRGLLAPFLDGLLEEARPNTRIIDGHEASYFYDRPDAYTVGRSEVRNASAWASADLQAKYAQQVEVAQPVYIDWITGRVKMRPSPLVDQLSTPDRMKFLATQTRAALANSDRYAWVYSEQMSWWTRQNLPPGAEEALRAARSSSP